MIDITEQAFKLWIEYNMEIGKDKDNNQPGGVLLKDIIKSHLKKENELENEIRVLKEKIKSTSTPSHARMYNIFEQMSNYIELRLDSDGYYYLSVHDCPLSVDDMEFMERQIRNCDEQKFLRSQNDKNSAINSKFMNDHKQWKNILNAIY